MTYLVMAVLLGANAFAEPSPLDKAKELAGVYHGHWIQFGPDGKISMSWDDCIEAANPRLENGRAVVTATDNMDFTFPRKFSMQQVFTEGFFINPENGSAGNHFFEYSTGELLQEIEADQNTWTINATVNLAPYASLGITKENSIFASSVSVKTSTFAGGFETQHVTQTTTLVWKDTNGQIQSKQWVSLNGVHQRSLSADGQEHCGK